MNRADEKARYPTEFTKRAPPYAGRGPHPVVVVRFSPEQGTDSMEPSAGHLPDGWEADGKSWPVSTQLVLCEYGELTGETVEEDCRYTGAGIHDLTVWVEKAKYTYRLYEAKTSRLVTTFQVDGSGGCPRDVLVEDNAPLSIPQDVDREGLVNSLRPYVERNGGSTRSART
ncbi:hypothetical protein [Streptomyces sp. NPDC059063]|uniref:hypothetical protein n=1 Tax=unclassified Streptomyces TaxID=2593676 RepID=UPI0036C78016